MFLNSSKILLACLLLFCWNVDESSSQNCKFRNSHQRYYRYFWLQDAINIPDDLAIGSLLREEPVDGILYRVDLAANSTKFLRPNVITHNTSSSSSSDYENEMITRLSNYSPNYSATLSSAGSSIRFLIESPFSDYLDYERKEDLYINITLYCGDGSYTVYFWRINFRDTNNRPPLFNFQEKGSVPRMSIALQLPWSSSEPINFFKPIIARDHDYELSNANLTFSSIPSDIIWIYSEPKFGKNVSGPLRPQTYDYELKLLLLPKYSLPGNYSIEIRVTDGIHASRMNISLEIYPSYYYYDMGSMLDDFDEIDSMFSNNDNGNNGTTKNTANIPAYSFYYKLGFCFSAAAIMVVGLFLLSMLCCVCCRKSSSSRSGAHIFQQSKDIQYTNI